jgi:2-amino-4-hydroxy-6-hydroxymethyldihydropteridine diphosphokinase / dihydropteroate synthase
VPIISVVTVSELIFHTGFTHRFRSISVNFAIPLHRHLTSSRKPSNNNIGQKMQTHKSMYVTDQPPFLNAVAEIRTDLKPRALLRALQSIETDLGRDRNAPRFGPRPIDLDIVLYGKSVVELSNNVLTIPHARLHERMFVLQPLCDIDDSVLVPGQPAACGNSSSNEGTVTARQLLDQLKSSASSKPSHDGLGGLTRLSPLRHSKRGFLAWDGSPKLMGIVNVTPDSFSDGGRHQTVDQALRLVEDFVKHDFDVIDVGQLLRKQSAKAIRDMKKEAIRLIRCAYGIAFQKRYLMMFSRLSL